MATFCTQPRDAMVSDIMFAKVLGTRSAVIALAATLEAKGIGNVADLQSHVEAMIRRLAATSPRSRPLDSKISVDRSLGSNCVRYDLTREAPATPGATLGTGIVTTRAVRCLHPQWPAYAVDVGYAQLRPAGPPPVAADLELEPFLTSLQFSSDRPLPLVRIPVGESPHAIGIGHGSIWVVAAATTFRIDPQTNQVVAKLPVNH